MASRSDGRVLVTGCSGFTGQYLADVLAGAGYQVVDPEAGQAKFDLADREGLEAAVAAARPDYVIHLAAKSFVGHGDAADFYRINTVGTTNLLDALVSCRCNPLRIILASSANVYGNATDDPISERTAPAPVNHYAASKLAMEHLAAAYTDRFEIVIVRPFNYTGIGQPEHFLVPKLVAHFAERRASIELGNIDVVRDFSDVRAVAAAYLHLLRAERPAPVTNLCSGVGRSLRMIVDDLTALSGHRIDITVNPDLVRTNEVRRLVGDPAMLNSTLGALPYQDFRATLEWMLASRQKLSVR